MNIIKTILLVICLLSNYSLQAQIWNWAQSPTHIGGSFLISRPPLVCSDNDGNLLVAGQFECDTLKYDTQYVVNSGSDDVSLFKFDTSGNVLWGRDIGGGNYEFVNAVTADPFGNVYVFGRYNSDSIKVGNVKLVNQHIGEYEMYLMKFNDIGDLVWAKNIAGYCYGNPYFSDFGLSMKTDKSGNLYCTGNFNADSIQFGTIKLYNSTNSGTLPIYWDLFVVKFDSSGNTLWATKAGGPDNDVTYSLAIDDTGNAYIFGSFASSAITFGSNTLHKVYDGTTFIVKYNPNGNVLWAKLIAGASITLTKLVLDSKNNIYITGSFQYPYGIFGNDTLYSTGSVTPDVFLAKYTNSGDLIWAQKAWGQYSQTAVDMAIDFSDNIWITGYYYDTTHFGAITLPDSKVNVDGSTYVAKYNSSGVAELAEGYPAGNDQLTSLCVNRYGDLFFGGAFQVIDSIIIGKDTLKLSGDETAFIAKAKVSHGLPVSNVEYDPDIYIYPNPARNEFVFTFKNNSIKAGKLELYNLTGTLYATYTIKASKTAISVSAVPAGIYFCRFITNEAGIFTKKFIVLH
jgi:hypothetical protein